MMRPFFWLLAAALAWAAPADAWLAQKPVSASSTSMALLSATTTSPSNAADRFMALDRSHVPLTATDKLTLFPVPGKLTRITAWVNGTAPSGSATWTITVLQNDGDTALQCEINSGSSGTCTITTDVNFTAGQWGAIRIRPANSPSTQRIQVETIFVPTTANDTILTSWSGASGFSNSTTQAQVPSSALAPGIASVRRFPPFAASGTVDKLHVASNAPSATTDGKKYVYTVNKNASSAGSPPTCEILETATACNDSTNSQSVTGSSGSTAGDDIQTEAAPTSSPTAAVAGIGLRYIPSSCAGCYLYMYGTTTSSGTSGSTFFPISGGSSGGVTTESQVQSRVKSGTTFKKIAVKLGTAPGSAASGKKRNYFLRVNETDTGLTCEILETATACEFSADVAVNDNERLDVADVATNTPAASAVYFSLLASR